jgi:hypothetical protein
MTDDRVHPALGRLLADDAIADAVDLFGDEVAGSDLSTLLLEVARRHVAPLRPADVLAQYRRDRFVRPSAFDPRDLLDVERQAWEVVSPPFVPITTSPLVPLGTHAVIGGVHQDRVVTTTRGSEVAADPTNTLALEAAVRRRALLDTDPRADTVVDLASIDRIVRAQRFEGPRSFAHFSLLGLVSAGRDAGGHAFERTTVVRHVVALAGVVRSCGLGPVRVGLTAVDERRADAVDEIRDRLGGDGIDAVAWPERPPTGGYYPDLCFKLWIRGAGGDAAARDAGAGDLELDDVELGDVELGDGGIVDWSQRLIGSRKERMAISGLSIDRVASLMVERS